MLVVSLVSTCLEFLTIKITCELLDVALVVKYQYQHYSVMY